jgi:hypothetical protein
MAVRILPAAYVLALILSGCASQVATLPAKHAVTPFAGPFYWTPSPGDIAALENDLGELWVRPDRRVSERPRLPLSDYVVRYRGEIEKDKRVVIGEGRRFSGEEAARYLADRTEMVMTPFGDTWFTVRYDPEQKKIVSLKIVARASL